MKKLHSGRTPFVTTVSPCQVSGKEHMACRDSTASSPWPVAQGHHPPHCRPSPFFQTTLHQRFHRRSPHKTTQAASQQRLPPRSHRALSPPRFCPLPLCTSPPWLPLSPELTVDSGFFRTPPGSTEWKRGSVLKCSVECRHRGISLWYHRFDVLVLIFTPAFCLGHGSSFPSVPPPPAVLVASANIASLYRSISKRDRPRGPHPPLTP
ncbi:uncharacterized protein LOC134760690 [Pongo abelii]|uniref:uncharacterized protein LOC134760690 n=1 Tax=Pongo abelii TaxID=9601 RepID=UPI0030060B2E